MGLENKKVVIEASLDEKGPHINFQAKSKSSGLKKLGKVANLIDSVGMLSALIAYVLFGTLGNFWYCAWVVFFVPDIISSILRCIAKKDMNQLNVCFIATFSYFFTCMWVPGLNANIWHPMWVVFLCIPIYYIVVSQIKDFKKD